MWVNFWENRYGTINGAGTVYPAGAPDFTPGF